MFRPGPVFKYYFYGIHPFSFLFLHITIIRLIRIRNYGNTIPNFRNHRFSFMVPSGQTSADIACAWDYHTNDPSCVGLVSLHSTQQQGRCSLSATNAVMPSIVYREYNFTSATLLKSFILKVAILSIWWANAMLIISKSCI